MESFKRETGFKPYQPFTDLSASSLCNGSLDPKRGFKSQSFKCDRTKSVLRLFLSLRLLVQSFWFIYFYEIALQAL